MEYESSERSRLLTAAVVPQEYGSYHTVDSAESGSSQMDKVKSKKLPQYIAALAAAGGALASGTVLGWTAPAEKPLTVDNEYGFKITDDQFSWLGSSMTLGAAFICVFIGKLVDWYGRKMMMLTMVVPFIIGWALVIWASGFEMLIIGRTLLGVAGGAFCVAAPIYTGEIAQKDIRGVLGTFFQLMVTIGILFVYAVGSGVNVFTLSIICGVIPLVFAVVFFFMPETPLYWVKKDRTESAIKSIKWLRGSQFDHEEEVTALQTQNEMDKQLNVPVKEALCRKTTVKALYISIGLMFFQQVSGINAVIFFQTAIFQAGGTDLDSDIATIIVGTMQVLATLGSSFVVDRLGRRILLLASSLAMAICTLVLGVFFYLSKNQPEKVVDIGWLPVAALCVFIVMFSFGFGPVPWLMIGELFAPDIKGVASSIAGCSNWLLAFLITKTFKDLREGIGYGETFWLYSGFTFVGTIFVFFLVPETRGKSLDEIQKMLANEEPTSTGDKV